MKFVISLFCLILALLFVAHLHNINSNIFNVNEIENVESIDGIDAKIRMAELVAEKNQSFMQIIYHSFLIILYGFWLKKVYEYWICGMLVPVSKDGCLGSVYKRVEAPAEKLGNDEYTFWSFFTAILTIAFGVVLGIIIC